MSMSEHAPATDATDCTVTRAAGITEHAEAHGRYEFVCRGPDGVEKWRETIDNVVCTLGKNLLLDTGFGGSGYTVTGPYMGLISSSGFSAVSAADTMSSHAGWVEAGNANAPQYSGNRKTAVFAAASGGSKSLSAALTFTFTGAGTVQGGFLCYGTGAVNTIDNTSGTLYSASTFASGSKAVGVGDSVAVSYTASL